MPVLSSCSSLMSSVGDVLPVWAWMAGTVPSSDKNIIEINFFILMIVYLII
jgi:hypothetical protein